MGCRARLDANQTGRQLLEELDHLTAAQLSRDDNLTLTINAMHLEYILGEIQTNRVNLHMEGPLGDSANDHPMALRCRSGRSR